MMVKLAEDLSTSQSLQAGDAEVIRRLAEAITGGEHWYTALLEAMGRWGAADEVCNGRTCRYLIDGEAFDWLLLAERLCQAVDGLLPGDEKYALLFYGRPPLDLGLEKVKSLIGDSKYNQYLNYFYGITVEKALVMAVQQEVEKERHILRDGRKRDTENEAYRRIYGTGRGALLKRFRREKGYPHSRSISLDGLKEFTYWLFKYRLEQCDKARVASDTRKALTYLKCLWTGRGFYGVLATDGLLAERRG